MLVKENLLLAYGNYNNTPRILNYTTSAIAPIEKGEKYTISYTVKNSNRFGVYTDTLSNGIFEPYTDIIENESWGTTKEGKKINYTFTADKDGYVIVYLSNGDGNVKEPDLKIEQGEEKTLYIPGKNFIVENNRQYYPPEGY